ncbi:UNVERIFIED_CONTAM: hypothetical protein Slati_3725400 [Sesamum latifolium]|uniref:Retrotransposon gag domain-containing protein n=1 Tax=Sesamum latifolium TaxID=2727402 RepID=A0AAW2U3C7_9LAMI
MISTDQRCIEIRRGWKFLNLVQGDNQTVAEYELRFAALAKYAPEAVVTQEDRCYHFEQGLRPEIRKGLAVRITDFKTLVESAVRMEEAVIEEKKRMEEKRKSMYTLGESSRSTKRGTGRSFSLGGGTFLGGPAFRGSRGPQFGRSTGFNRSSFERSSFTMPSGGSGREWDRVMVGDQLFHRVVLSMEDNIWGHVGDEMI